MNTHASSATRKTHSASIKPSIINFDSLPNSALVDDKTVAVVTGQSRNTVWRKSKAGTLPAPIKVGPKTTRWKVGEIRAYIARLTAESAAAA